VGHCGPTALHMRATACSLLLSLHLVSAVLGAPLGAPLVAPLVPLPLEAPFAPPVTSHPGGVLGQRQPFLNLGASTEALGKGGVTQGGGRV